MKERISVILPTYREKNNIPTILKSILSFDDSFEFEILVVDDDSDDGTAELVKAISRNDSRVRLIHRVGRFGLASAIKEGLLDATGDIAVVMDADGQHQVIDAINAVRKLKHEKLDLVIGSRFLSDATVIGLSNKRKEGSSIANMLARYSLPGSYSHLTDYMSGCIAINLSTCMSRISQVDVYGFKFLYELLSVTRNPLLVEEVPLAFQPRLHGTSKLDLSILWDFFISLVHTFTLRLLPRRAISFAFVGFTGVIVQLSLTQILMQLFSLSFESSIKLSVLAAATSNYLVNNLLTFRSNRLKGILLFKGLFKFLLVASLPVIANVGLATAFYNIISSNTFLAQMAGILVVFIWNYVASSRFVWNTP